MTMAAQSRLKRFSLWLIRKLDRLLALICYWLALGAILLALAAVVGFGVAGCAKAFLAGWRLGLRLYGGLS